MKNIIVALGLVEWESQFVSGLGHPMFGLNVSRRCVDGVDVRAAIQVIDCQGVIVTDATPRIDQDLLAELGEIPLIAITSNPDFWNDFGVAHCISLGSTNPTSFVKLVAEYLSEETQAPKAVTPAKGLHVAVAGFGGSCGRTMTTKELSWQLAKHFGSSIMIDADTYGPSLDQELGYEPNLNSILEVCRSLEKRSELSQHDFDLLPEIKPGLSVIPGLPRVSRWTDLRVPALRELWLRAKQQYEFVISDVGPILELDHSLLHETSLPRRHATALTALESAQVTIICARADSVGLARLVRGYLEFHELFSKSDVHVVLWGVSSDAHARDVCSAVSRHTGIGSITVIPFGWEASQNALMSNSFISKQNPKHEIAKQFEKLANTIEQHRQSENVLLELVKPRKKLLRRAA